MVHSAPVNRFTLVAASAADDAGFVALHDVSQVLSTPGLEIVLVIGGYMVTLHAQRWGLDLFRQTQDADLGVPQLVMKNAGLVAALERRGYSRVESNRLAKPLRDLPVGAVGSDQNFQAIIDVLVPALTSHPRKSVEVGDVTTTEVVGLAEALNRSPVIVDLELVRLNKERLPACLRIPDERSALTLKVLAWDTRRAEKDAVDVWRCLELANVASLTSKNLESDDGVQTMRILERAFGSENADGIQALARAQKLNPVETGARSTRIRALIQKLKP